MTSLFAGAVLWAAFAGASPSSDTTGAIAPARGLVLSQRDPGAPKPAAAEGTVFLDADLLEYEGQARRAVARGNVVLRTRGAVVRADRMVYEEGSSRITAFGNARAVFGTYAAIAREVQVSLKDGDLAEASLVDAVLMQKEDATTEELLAAATPEALRRIGRTSVALTGTRVTRVGPDEFRVEDLSFTPCDCRPDQASWRIQASRGDVIPGERAVLRFPVVYVGSWPVLPLPWLYLPLSDRRTGLLMPRPDYNPTLSGFSLEWPVFVTLGQSHDVTFTPGWYSGGTPPVSGQPWQGVQGPRLLTELRYVPSTSTSGRVSVDLIHDARPVRHPFHPTLVEDRARGLRGQVLVQHAQALGAGVFSRVDAALLSDAYYWRDLTADVLARETDYQRSTATVYRRGEGHHLGLAVAYRQDISQRENLGVGSRLFGPDAFGGERLYGPSTLQELPSASFSVPLRPLWGPLEAGVRAELTRHSPVGSSTGDEGSLANEGRFFDEAGTPLTTDCVRQRLFSSTPQWGRCPGGAPLSELGQGDRVFQPGEREARVRADVMPRMAVNVPVGPLDVVAHGGWRQSGYYGEVTGRTDHRGYPLAGLSVQTELARALGEAVAHSLTPAVELRSVPFVVQSRAPAPYDELDQAIPADGYWLQGVAELRNRLMTRGTPARREVVRLDLAQGFDVLRAERRSALRETSARVGAWHGPLSVYAVARYDAPRQVLTQLTTAAGLASPGGFSISAAFDHLAMTGTDQSHRGIDSLIGYSPDDLFSPPRFGQQVSGSLGQRFGFGLSLRYSLLLSPYVEEPDLVRPGELVKGPLLRQQQVDVSYGPACDCWRLDLFVRQQPRPGESLSPFAGEYAPLQFGLNFTLARFGSIGRGG